MVLALAMVCCVQAQRLQTGQDLNQPHDWSRFVVNTTVSAGMAFGVKTILKNVVNEERPDHSDDQSFPSGHTALAFAVALELPIEQTRELLMKAGYTLSRSIFFDVILEYCILQENYNIHEINAILYEYDLPLLGG